MKKLLNTLVLLVLMTSTALAQEFDFSCEELPVNYGWCANHISGGQWGFNYDTSLLGHDFTNVSVSGINGESADAEGVYHALASDGFVAGFVFDLRFYNIPDNGEETTVTFTYPDSYDLNDIGTCVVIPEPSYIEQISAGEGEIKRYAGTANGGNISNDEIGNSIDEAGLSYEGAHYKVSKDLFDPLGLEMAAITHITARGVKYTVNTIVDYDNSYYFYFDETVSEKIVLNISSDDVSFDYAQIVQGQDGISVLDTFSSGKYLKEGLERTSWSFDDFTDLDIDNAVFGKNNISKIYISIDGYYYPVTSIEEDEDDWVYTVDGLVKQKEATLYRIEAIEDTSLIISDIAAFRAKHIAYSEEDSEYILTDTHEGTQKETALRFSNSNLSGFNSRNYNLETGVYFPKSGDKNYYIEIKDNEGVTHRFKVIFMDLVNAVISESLLSGGDYLFTADEVGSTHNTTDRYSYSIITQEWADANPINN